MRRSWALVLVGTAVAATCFAESDGPVARWALDEGTGSVARAGELEGQVHNAEWAPCGEGHALRFDGDDAYVDCGAPACLDLTGAITLSAWVYPTARPDGETGIAGKSFDSYAMTAYGDGNFYWYVSSGGNKCSTPAKIAHWNHLAGTFDGNTLTLYRNGELVDSRPSQFDTINRGGRFYIGRIMRYAHQGTPSDGFEGYVDDVRVYDRALSPEEVHSQHEEERVGYRRMEAGLDRIVLTPFYYLDQGRILADIDFGNLAPLEPDEHAVLTLWREGTDTPLQQIPISEIPDSGIVRDLAVELPGLEAGDYALRVDLANETETQSAASAQFACPPRFELPPPNEKAVASLPSPDQPVDYEVDLLPDGGFRICLEGASFIVASHYSYPQGRGERLRCIAIGKRRGRMGRALREGGGHVPRAGLRRALCHRQAYP